MNEDLDDLGDLDQADATRIDEDQIALVHAGELIVAAPGSRTPSGQLRRQDGTTEVHYWFPVQVEVVGLDDATAAQVVARVFDELGRELDGQG